MPDPMFKVGDHIKCVDPNTHTKTVGAPVLNGTYTVSEIYEQYEDKQLIKVLGCDTVFWSLRFELAKWIPKVGDVVNASKWVKWPKPRGMAINKPIKEIDKYTNYTLPDQPLVDLYMVENENGTFQWWPLEALTRADGTQPSVPQRKKRVYND